MDNIWRRISQLWKKQNHKIEETVPIPSLDNNGRYTVLYVGCNGDGELVSHLTKNAEDIVSNFKGISCELVLYPSLKSEAIDINNRWSLLLSYYHPEWRGRAELIANQLKSIGSTEFYESICSCYQVKYNNTPFLLLTSNNFTVDQRIFPLQLNRDIADQLNSIFKEIENATRREIDDDISFYNADSPDSSSETDDEYNADTAFEDETSGISRKVAEQLEVLLKTAENETLLNIYSTFLKRTSVHRPALLKEFDKIEKSIAPVALSRLVVEKHGRILLPDFNNLEIKLTPLQKTVYLFFLKHPQGVMFHDLVDHRNELLDIYGRTTNSSSNREITKRIEDLTDIRSNSINEKCSRIKEAFVKEMHDSIANNYYINGGRNTVKKIPLPSDLIQISPEFR